MKTRTSHRIFSVGCQTILLVCLIIILGGCLQRPRPKAVATPDVAATQTRLVELAMLTAAVQPTNTPVPPPPTPPPPTSTAPPTPTFTPLPNTDLTSLASVSVPRYAEPGLDTCNPANRTTFIPQNLVDGQTTTAWRVKGDASGDYISFEFARSIVLKEIDIVPGYAKTDPCTPTLNWCVENRIPKTMQAQFSDGTAIQFELAPNCTWQRILVDGVMTTSVRFTILATYPYQSRDYTPVSEIKFLGYLSP